MVKKGFGCLNHQYLHIEASHCCEHLFELFLDECGPHFESFTWQSCNLAQTFLTQCYYGRIFFLP